ncbi:hypothetical protein E2C01_043690 [Portunus trituberculatus]|uniref:Uncharacterized protein n=1 Tax=Portunus trituberculatus TaxID=210409 RepID=A0A5B7FX18_PORTR|nr:hypothetical protein [Portunus trituberculatus]
MGQEERTCVGEQKKISVRGWRGAVDSWTSKHRAPAITEGRRLGGCVTVPGASWRPVGGLLGSRRLWGRWQTSYAAFMRLEIRYEGESSSNNPGVTRILRSCGPLGGAAGWSKEGKQRMMLHNCVSRPKLYFITPREFDQTEKEKEQKEIKEEEEEEEETGVF